MAKRAMHLGHLYSLQPPVLAGVAPRQPLPAGQRLEVVDQAVVAAVQEKVCRTTPVPLGARCWRTW